MVFLNTQAQAQLLYKVVNILMFILIQQPGIDLVAAEDDHHRRRHCSPADFHQRDADSNARNRPGRSSAWTQ
jgi:hypothetical protein